METPLSNRIVIGSSKGLKQVEVGRISHILCEDYLCTLHLINISESITCTKSLRYFEQALQSFPFVRIHYHAMVNLEKVTEVSCKGRQHHVVMTDGTVLPIAVRRWLTFRNAFYANALAPSNGTVVDPNDTLTRKTRTAENKPK
ncbi:MAG: LytTR family transcriptional regulator [Bacteroidales bacterium]|nr:LytTR family transcriptional regulator [Bacteroidales bacterium]